jgi:hypothetical protein
MKFLSYALYGAYGVLLASQGFGLATWQFWVFMLMFGVVDVLSFARALHAR